MASTGAPAAHRGDKGVVTAQILLARPAAEVGKRASDGSTYTYKHLAAPTLWGFRLRVFVALVEPGGPLSPFLYHVLARKSNIPQVCVVARGVWRAQPTPLDGCANAASTTSAPRVAYEQNNKKNRCCRRSTTPRSRA